MAAYRPACEQYLAFREQSGLEPVFAHLDDLVERSPALIGRPERIVEKVHSCDEQFGHTGLHLQAEPGRLPPTAGRASLEPFQSEIAPVLRREIPDPPFADL
ncbi:hypothetical protein [Streptomyces sp. NPDC001436]